MEKDASLIQVSQLNFRYTNTSTVWTDTNEFSKVASGSLDILHDIDMQVKGGRRCLVVGANGAGKSTILRVFAGKHLIPNESIVRICGKDSFRDTTLNLIRTYVGTDWGQRPVAFASYAVALTADIGVTEMMVKLQEEFPYRREKLMKVLRINPAWRMHQVSDGQRKRVQLFLALLRPSRLILLDEVLGVLDIIARQDLLQFLKEECENEGATVLLATNVFDGLEDWSTDVLYLKKGRLGFYGPTKEIPELHEFHRRGCTEPLMRSIETWLRRELEDDATREEQLHEKDAGMVNSANAQISAGGYAPGRFAGIYDPQL